MASIKDRINTSTNNVKSGKDLIKKAINDNLSGNITSSLPTFQELANSINSRLGVKNLKLEIYDVMKTKWSTGTNIGSTESPNSYLYGIRKVGSGSGTNINVIFLTSKATVTGTNYNWTITVTYIPKMYNLGSKTLTTKSSIGTTSNKDTYSNSSPSYYNPSQSSFDVYPEEYNSQLVCFTGFNNNSLCFYNYSSGTLTKKYDNFVYGGNGFALPQLMKYTSTISYYFSAREWDANGDGSNDTYYGYLYKYDLSTNSRTLISSMGGAGSGSDKYDRTAKGYTLQNNVFTYVSGVATGSLGRLNISSNTISTIYDKYSQVSHTSLSYSNSDHSMAYVTPISGNSSPNLVVLNKIVGNESLKADILTMKDDSINDITVKILSGSTTTSTNVNGTVAADLIKNLWSSELNDKDFYSYNSGNIGGFLNDDGYYYLAIPVSVNIPASGYVYSILVISRFK